MSEAERKRRLEYRKFRKKWIAIQAAVLAVVLLACAAVGAVYFGRSQTRYITYGEQSTVDYGAYYKGSSVFLDGTYHGKDFAYVAGDIETFVSTFEYKLRFDAEKINFKYTYRIDARVEVLDKTSGKPIFVETEAVVPETVAERVGNELKIHEQVALDYQKYNANADRFSIYEGLESRLVLQLTVNVVGASEEFSENSHNSFVATLAVPLCKEIIDTKLTSSVPQTDSKILAYVDAENVHTWKVATVILAIVSFLLIVEFIAFLYLTRNTDVTYDIRLGRLVKSYKSFIQKITNAFDDNGYQLLFVSSFTEMLEIRDTIQSPILMNENDDRTCTRFLIPTNTKLLYVYELKVDDYDEIYNTPVADAVDLEAAAPSEEPAAVETVAIVEDAPVVEEEIIPEATEKAKTVLRVVVKTAPKATEEPGEEIAEESASAVYSRVRRSFLSKLIQSNEAVKDYYSEIKNELLSYRKVKSRISWNCDTFNQGRVQLARINVRGKTLCLYLALDPAAYAESKYFFTDMSGKAQYETTPMMLKIKSARGVKHAKELIADLAKNLELVKNPSYEIGDFAPAYESTEALIAQGLIRDPFGEYSKTE